MTEGEVEQAYRDETWLVWERIHLGYRIHFLVRVVSEAPSPYVNGWTVRSLNPDTWVVGFRDLRLATAQELLTL